MDPHVVADDVAGGAALNLSKREHCIVERGDRAADEGLEGADQGSGHDDRIDTAFRVSAVAGSAVQIDQYFVAGSVELAVLHLKFSGVELRHDMETGDIVYVRSFMQPCSPSAVRLRPFPPQAGRKILRYRTIHCGAAAAAWQYRVRSSYGHRGRRHASSRN